MIALSNMWKNNHEFHWTWRRPYKINGSQNSVAKYMDKIWNFHLACPSWSLLFMYLNFRFHANIFMFKSPWIFGNIQLLKLPKNSFFISVLTIHFSIPFYPIYIVDATSLLKKDYSKGWCYVDSCLQKEVWQEMCPLMILTMIQQAFPY